MGTYICLKMDRLIWSIVLLRPPAGDVHNPAESSGKGGLAVSSFGLPASVPVIVKTPRWAVGLLAAWSVGIGMLLLGLGIYSAQQGSRGTIPQILEDETTSALSAHFFVHPQCPCSASSVEELDRLLSRLGRSVSLNLTAHVYEPTQKPPGWVDSPMVTRLRRMNGVRVLSDPDGAKSASFGVLSSGHLLLYRQGQLQFSGGLTSLRGHGGLSESGEAAYRVFMNSNPTGTLPPVNWVVFGCPVSADVAEECEGTIEVSPR